MLAHLGAAAPLCEPDVRAAGALRPTNSSLRLLGFLRDKGMLTATRPRADTDTAAVARARQRVPVQFHGDFDAWTAVLRGRGRRPSLTVSWATIRSYQLSRARAGAVARGPGPAGRSPRGR
ncbi:hypothetical protein [Saccharothrix sp. NRRL B-16348]|uniref:hypothetical protein n=1 Tax=Saccharothrix sp. NRRL B-16348 TaxID=1415542 RepID=UPI0012F95B3B|nr:hypothetical protein [Saccharothrix sp. NRRL B-16348]